MRGDPRAAAHQPRAGGDPGRSQGPDKLRRQLPMGCCCLYYACKQHTTRVRTQGPPAGGRAAPCGPSRRCSPPPRPPPTGPRRAVSPARAAPGRTRPPAARPRGAGRPRGSLRLGEGGGADAHHGTCGGPGLGARGRSGEGWAAGALVRGVPQAPGRAAQSVSVRCSHSGAPASVRAQQGRALTQVG
jgi:hypothetical protein